MASDFPAAHSMDTQWFAVDAAGHVGYFSSGENGHVPEIAGPDIINELMRLVEAPPIDMEENGVYEPEKEAQSIRVIFYNYGLDFDPINAYEREGCPPERPLHIDELPPELRDVCNQVQFPSLRFDETERLQPLEFFPCVYWYEEDRIAYRCADGVTIRPIPGKEARFAEFVREWRSQDPENTARLIFDGPTE